MGIFGDSSNFQSVANQKCILKNQLSAVDQDAHLSDMTNLFCCFCTRCIISWILVGIGWLYVLQFLKYITRICNSVYGTSRVEKMTFYTFYHVQYNGCFKHMEYRLSMSKKTCHTIIFRFRVVGPQSWVLRVTKLSRFLRYPQDTSHLICFFHVQMNTYNLL